MHTYDTMLSQYNMNKGIKLLGEKVVDTVTSKLQQLNAMDTGEPLISEKITRKQKQGSRMYLMVFKWNRYGMIKRRGCADGRK